MSPSRPERLRILVGRNGLLLLGNTPRSIPLPPSDAPQEEAILRRFGQVLAEAKPRSVDVLLSSELVDTVVLPGLEHWLTEADLQALGRSKLAAFYGTDQSARAVIASREAYGIPGLAMSVSRRLLEGLRAQGAGYGTALAGPRPLAALMVEGLTKELSQPQPTAVWIEEADTVWLGLRADGQWRSARSLPASMLRHTARSDLLQRECLAAGLVGVERICHAAVGVDGTSDWGARAIDCTGRLAQLPGRSTGIFDFGRKPRPRLGWTVLAAALAGVAATAYAWIDGQAKYAAASEALVQRRQTQTQAAETQRSADDALQAEYARALVAYRLQRLPWADLLTALNESGSDAIGLTDFKADALDGTLALAGEAKRFEDVQAFADALGARPQVRGLRITSMAPGGESSGGRVKFAIAATWHAALPREVPRP